jgi:hypothetical protein
VAPLGLRLVPHSAATAGWNRFLGRFGADGQFYAVEFSKLGLVNGAPGTGAVVCVAPGSTSPQTVVDDLNFPGRFAAGSDGSLYFSNWSIAPASSGMGAVERVQLH